MLAADSSMYTTCWLLTACPMLQFKSLLCMHATGGVACWW